MLACGGGGSSPSAGQAGSAGNGATGGGSSGGSAGRSNTGGTGTSGSGNGVDLCAGLVQDTAAHTQTALAQPAVGQIVTDAEFGTTIRRITAVPAGTNAAIKPMYSTISAWNADESLLILYRVGSGHQLYDGKSYAFIRALDINPADLEQVYWDTSDPDLLYYVDGQDFVRYHVQSSTREPLRNFASLCGAEPVSGGGDPMFTSWDSHRLGLVCGTQMFIYDQSTDSVLGPQPVAGTPPGQVAPSGTLAYLAAGTGQVLDENLNLVRSLNLQEPNNHASLGRLTSGHDTWNGAVYDDANEDVGILVTWDLTDRSGGVMIGPKTGYPYPPDGHISALAYRQPGWVVVSTVSDNTTGPQGLLDQELLFADTNTGTVCRLGRHRSFGKNNAQMQEPYWAEPHAVPSPSGTRVAFGSDWGGGATVDTYVVELPSY
jgi:hypothetical protein